LLRTFVIVTIGWVFDVAGTAWEAIAMFFRIFMPFTGNWGVYVPPFRSIAALLFCAVLLAVSLAHERGISIRRALDEKPFILQVFVWTALIQLTACFGRFVASGGFMYANF
ncbi:MAG: hypothetical protein IJV91_11170, partial [Kiritimatiellae bacterium]|nr:hypothetical protein [Kiritimatiellia bacterium]